MKNKEKIMSDLVLKCAVDYTIEKLLTPRNPMMDFWRQDLTLGGTKNQRDNDHDDVQAERHTREIDNKISHKNLVTPNYVIDYNLEIDFGGTITLRDMGDGLILTSDGLSRNTKIFLICLALRDACENKSIFDNYVFRNGTKSIRLQFMDEVGVFVNKAYQQTNDIVAQLLLRDTKIEYLIEDNLDESLYNQNYYVLKQLGAYSKWVNNHDFKSDDERLIAFENILNLYRVVYTKSINDVDSFTNNSDEVGVPTNGISAVANKVLTYIQNKYCSKSNQNDFINETINEQIKFIFSPVRMRVKPIKKKVIEAVSWIIQSYYTTDSGYDTKDARDTILNVVTKEITDLLDVEIEKYGTRDDDEIHISSDDSDIIFHLKTTLKNWSWHNELNSINRYFDDGIIPNSGGTRWIPLLLKYERLKRRNLNVEEIRTIQMFDIFGKFVKWGTGWSKLLGHAINDIDEDTELMDLLVSRFVLDSNDRKTGKVIYEIDFKNQLVNNFILAKGQDKDSDPNNKYYKYIDRLLSKMMIKGNVSNWSLIDAYEGGRDNQLEHFLARKYEVPRGVSRSDVRLRGSNFVNLPSSVNGYVKDDPVKDKIKVVKGSLTTVGQLFAPNGQLEQPVSDLLHSDEYDVFRKDGFDNQDWIEITSVGVLGEKSNLSNNLIHKLRVKQTEVMMNKVLGV